MAAKKTEEDKGTRKGKVGELVSAKVPKEQFEAILKLEGIMGVDRSGVVANIISLWLYSQDWFSDMVKKHVGEKK